MIGVFDSGVGGLSILAEIRALMPPADLLYIADQARGPYGTKSLETVAEMSLDIAGLLASEGADAIVVACNTASAAALDAIRAKYPHVPIVGMEPAVKPAVAVTSSRMIGVFATAATFQGRLFESVVNTHAADVEIVGIACPEWVELVEEGLWDGPEAYQAVAGPVADAVDAGADALVLGCTHFAHLCKAITRAAGPDVAVIDPGPAVAAQTIRVSPPQDGSGTTTVMTTGDVAAMNRLLQETGIIESSGSALPLDL
jgi:glutamate racemase